MWEGYGASMTKRRENLKKNELKTTTKDFKEFNDQFEFSFWYETRPEGP
ncbi:MAG: hypothetical protein QXK93_06090 [Candidatus Bathyarchaeia archaeon]